MDILLFLIDQSSEGLEGYLDVLEGLPVGQQLLPAVERTLTTSNWTGVQSHLLVSFDVVIQVELSNEAFATMRA